MGHKTHPIGFRLGIIKEWDAKWYAHKKDSYRSLVLEDVTIRKAITKNVQDAGIAKVDIERGAHDIVITIHTSRPGIAIGRGGQRIEKLRGILERLTEKKARLNVVEVRQPELNAYLVAKNIAEALERRVAFRRAIRQSVGRAMQAGAQGIKVICSGRLGGAEIARKEKSMQGRVPLHTLRADIDYGLAEAATLMGRIGVKVWIYKGDILPQRQAEEEAQEMEPIEVTISPTEKEEEAQEMEPTEAAISPTEKEEVATETEPVEAAIKPRRKKKEVATETEPVEAAIKPRRKKKEVATETEPVEAAIKPRRKKKEESTETEPVKAPIKPRRKKKEESTETEPVKAAIKPRRKKKEESSNASAPEGEVQETS